MISNNTCLVWNPWYYFNQGEAKSSHAIFILNNTIRFPFDPKVLVNIWNQAIVRVTVDGGTDQWISWIKDNNICDSAPISLITGDFDSVLPSTLESLKNTVKIIQTSDQNETDFTKSLKELSKYLKENDLHIDSIIAIDDCSGRLDQVMANINTLFKGLHILPGVQIFKLAKDSISWILTTGSHIIHIPEHVLYKQNWCALIPLGKPCVVTTTGLKWNLKNTELSFGNLVSTSNTFNGENTVTVETSDELLWSMSIENLVN